MNQADLLAAGNDHSCALPTGSNTPQCWGRNLYGQLGNGTNNGSDTPVPVSGITTASGVDAGGILTGGVELAHSCARLTDDSVRCWGAGDFGQLGNDSTSASNVPVTVLSDDNNDHLNTPPPDPTPPVALSEATSVSTGGLHSCALLSTGRVRCWGSNANGQLGDGTNTDRHFAVTVDKDPDEPEADESDQHFDPLTGVIQVAAGGRHTCALKSDNTVWCWGRNASGQLGDGTTTARNVPVKALTSASVTIVDITAGDDHTCARVINGDGNTIALCWGSDASGQLGDDDALADKSTPVSPFQLGAPGGDVENVELVTSISAGRDNTCASLIDTTVRCWGDNAHGQVGDGVGQMSRTPVDVLSVGNVGGNLIPAPVDDAVSMPPPPTSPLVIDVLANDTDPDGDALTVASVGTPAKGGASTDGATVTYTPDPDFCTQDPTSFVDTFGYEATDGTATVPATVTVTVLCPNTPPVAGDVTITVDEDETTAIDVLAAASDINADPLTVVTGSASDPPHGTAVVPGDGSRVDYTPDPDYFGTDTFTFLVTDGTDVSNVATVHITVTNINDPPVGVDDIVVPDVPEDGTVDWDVIANDTDADRDALSIFDVGDPPPRRTRSRSVRRRSATRPTPTTAGPTGSRTS